MRAWGICVAFKTRLANKRCMVDSSGQCTVDCIIYIGWVIGKVQGVPGDCEKDGLWRWGGVVVFDPCSSRRLG